MLMGSQINDLLERYWAGQTSLDEERQIKAFYRSNPSLTHEGNYFRFLNKQKMMKMEEPKSVSTKKRWFSAAATVTVGIITAVLIFNDANQDPFVEEDPEKAFQATKKALLMIGAGLNEGQNQAMKLTKINKDKEELQEENEEQ